MTDDEAREIVRATLAHHVHGTRHGYTHAEVRQALERALVLFDEVERAALGLGDPPTTDELRAEAERLAREMWGRGLGDAPDAWRVFFGDLLVRHGEAATFRALVAALREIRRGDGPA